MIFDLVARVISSIALIALGVAGWRLQVRTQEARTKADAFVQQERRYLPMLRTLLELEVALDNASRALEAISTDQTGFAVAAMSVGTYLEAAGHSLFLPDGDKLVLIHVPDSTLLTGTGIQRDRGEEYMRVPLRSAVLMYADWLRTQHFLSQAAPNDWVTFDPSKGVLTIETADGPMMWQVTKDSRAAWSKWAPPHKFQALLLRYVRFPHLLQELRSATATITHDTLRDHPDLGERYVTIRSEVLRTSRVNSEIVH